MCPWHCCAYHCCREAALAVEKHVPLCHRRAAIQVHILRVQTKGLVLQAGGLAAFQSDPDKLKHAVEFAAACGGFTCSKPGAIAAQPTLEEAKNLMQSAKATV